MGNGKNTGGISSFSTILLTVVASIVGVALIHSLHVQYAPSPLKRNISVSFSWPDASPANVEAKATSILESVLSEVKYCSGITSTSSKGSGRINVSFPKKTDMAAARFEVASCIRNTYPSLPDGVTYPAISLDIGGRSDKTALAYVFKSDLPSKEIEKFITAHVLQKISTIDGVDKVSLNGATPFEWVIRFDNEKASSLGISSSDIGEAFRNWTESEEVGTASTSSGTMSVKIKSASSDDFGSMPIKKVGGRIIYLRDIATYQYKESLPQSYFRLNGLNTVTLSIGTASGVNLLSVGKAVRERMSELQRSFPSSITATLSYDSTDYIVKELDKIYLRTLLCIILLLLFVLVINRSWRYMLMIAITLTANLLVAVAFYAMVGIPIHIYTLAGITVSLGIIIDTSIVMIDHYGYYGDRKVFLSILGAVATTVAALLVVLLLPESERANLVDFIWVIIINLTVSLALAYFFVPALLDYMPIRRHRPERNRKNPDDCQTLAVKLPDGPSIADGTRPVRSRRRIMRWSHIYERYISFGMRHRWVYIVILIAAFGIPTCLLPEKIWTSSGKPLSKADSLYNRIIGWRPYADNKLKIDNILGTSFALFCKAVDGNTFYREPSRKELSINASMPEGCTVGQLNEVMRSMENYLAQFDEIESFTTEIDSYEDGNITVDFKPAFEKTAFPDNLKSLVTASAINFGGANWQIYGVNANTFDNNVISSYKSSRISMSGYNYETLIRYAKQLIDTLSKNKRVSEPEIRAGYYRAPDTELDLGYDFQKMAAADVNPYHYYSALSSLLYDGSIGSVITDGETTPVVLESSATEDFDRWNVLNSGVRVDSTYVRLADFGSIEKNRLELPIYKENQSYQINVCFDFIGSYELEKKVIDAAAKGISQILPVGYKAIAADYHWSEEHKATYAWLILLVIAVIFVICAMIFNSLRLPFSIIGIIPVSFIGIFLTFGAFHFPFDQGGFASFVMVAGLVVNAGIYLIVAYGTDNSRRNPVRKFVKAFNHKIVPITLTIISTVLGLIPFLFDGPSEVFWFAFAVGTISGLVFSVISVVFYLPVFMLKKR